MSVLRSAVATVVLIAGPAFGQTTGPQTMTLEIAQNGTVQASIDIGAEFPSLKGYEFEQTLTIVKPQTGRPMHSHAGAPEIVRILSGVLTDTAKNGVPMTYGPGSTVVNAAGKEHMWANLGSEPVVFIATSLRPKK